ncbi:MAG TPA: hypothetical protein VGA95_05525 [Thermodesulfobacteriota bacterium]
MKQPKTEKMRLLRDKTPRKDRMGANPDATDSPPAACGGRPCRGSGGERMDSRLQSARMTGCEIASLSEFILSESKGKFHSNSGISCHREDIEAISCLS